MTTPPTSAGSWAKAAPATAQDAAAATINAANTFLDLVIAMSSSREAEMARRLPAYRKDLRLDIRSAPYDFWIKS
ncbi:hypothetical protein [Brevundimonas sp. Root1423]|uniref:hypothetical protein n=1 Tax=Brevundimonas sp. Root1423 TaxID=1736462 RepID=UPI00138F170F|nr:hypothetical protein [Brevundimonas sp. Root1423]